MLNNVPFVVMVDWR